MKYKIIQIVPAIKGWYLQSTSYDYNGVPLSDKKGIIPYLEEIALFALIELEDGTTETRAMTGYLILDNCDIDLSLEPVFLDYCSVKCIRDRERRALSLISSQQESNP